MERNVPRPGQVHSGKMRRPGMNYSGTKFSDFAVIFRRNRKEKIYLQQDNVLQNLKKSVQAICRQCVALILISPAPICINWHLEQAYSVVPEDSFVPGLHCCPGRHSPDISPWTFPPEYYLWHSCNENSPGHPSLVDPLLVMDIDCNILAI